MTSAKVLQFPTKVIKADTHRAELYRRIEELDDCYDILEQVHDSLNQLEYHCHKLEQTYNIILGEYATLVDPAALEVDFLTYSTEAIVEEGEDGKFTIKWGKDGGPAEIVKRDEE